MRRTTPILVLLAACGPHRQPQSVADFADGIVLDIPVPAEEGSMGGAFFDALLEKGAPSGRVTLEPDNGLQLTCSIRHRHLEVSVLAFKDQLDDSRYARTDCVIGDVTLPIILTW
ncbi:MAG: hypothetical protein H6738_07470 [Alphaproteobacteria bacterium]|nr:hypothetical protein [Alphaproteobacteria bacterium]MCB9685055.1 hypothetical protein [Alphaproteobacteria bacterium]MCB9696603.1 hypothetical protein [Alphaproteobacteria bacterium]